MASSGDDRGPAVLAVTTAMIACATVFVFFRMVSRIGIVRKVSWDDYFMILAWLIAFGLSFSICYGTAFGLGRHQSDVLPSEERPLKMCQYIFTVLYNPALMATKTSILIFYLKLSQEQRIFRWASILTLVIVNVAGIALTFLNIFQCRPVGAALDTPVPSTARCIDVVSLYLSSAPVNISTDLAILFLPMPILTSMNLPRKQKAILVITFGFGVFVAVVDVIRIAYLENASLTRLKDIQNNSDNVGSHSRNQVDYSWYSSLSFMWSAVEVNIGIMCACVPALKPLVSRFLPRFLHDAAEPEYSGRPATSDAAMQPELGEAHRIPSVPDSPIKKPPPSAGNADGEMSFEDFLATTETDEMPENLRRTTTAMTNTTRHTRPNTPTFFDFVNMKGKKPMVQMSARESYFPVAMVTLLFFLWGFAYGLLDVLNSQFQAIAGMTSGQSIGIHCAYFGGYLIGPLTFGRLVLKNWGFKACYIVGLVIYAIGTLVFWPSAVLTSFPAFLVSNLIVGLGLSTLEIAANAFVALCGPAEYGEIRLNLSQGTQACGTVVAPLLASKVLFNNAQNAPALIDVQWTYLGIALFAVLLAVVYFYVPLPEASDAELEDAAERVDTANSAQIGGVKVIWLTLGLGVFSQFCYVGGQEALSTSFSDYLRVADPGLNVVNHQAIGHTAFAVGRFVCAFANFLVKPRYTLLFFFICAILFSALSMNFHGNTPAALTILIYFFEGPIFPLIYAISLRGLGRHTKDGSVLLSAAISGGAVFQPVMHAVQTHRSAQYAFCVIVAAFAAGTVFPLYLNAAPKAMRQVDPVKGMPGLDEETSPSPASSTRGSKAWENLKRRRKPSQALPATEHKERKSTPSPLREDSPPGVESLDFITSAA